jgi:hypothetical protein
MNMTNDYRSAEVIEFGNAGDMVLGEKTEGSIDSVTAEFGTRVIPETSD